MDFNGIEGLSDENIRELYEIVVENNGIIENDLISGCGCYFFYEVAGAYLSYYNRGSYCAMQINTYDKCVNWCSSKGLGAVRYYTEACDCGNKSNPATWYSCYK